MKRVCIAIIDATRARIYAYQEDLEPARQLHEVRDLVNPGRRLRSSEMFTEAHSSVRSSGEPASSYDDHRDAHIDMLDQKFAKEIVGEIDKVVRTDNFAHLIIIASPRMLGEVRKADGLLRRADLRVDEIANDLTTLTPSQLHDHLASLALIPPRTRLSMAR